MSENQLINLLEEMLIIEKNKFRRIPQYGDKYREEGEILRVWRYLPDYPNDNYPWMLTDDDKFITWTSDKDVETKNLKLVKTAGGIWGKDV